MTAVAIRSLAGPLGAEVRGIDLGGVVDDVALWRIRGAMLDHAIVVLRDQTALAPPELFGARPPRMLAPGAGEAVFVNLYRAYATLPGGLRAVARATLHPETRRKVLVLDDAMPELLDHAAAPENLYRHHWRAGDVILWDDRCVALRTWKSVHNGGYA